MKKLTEINYPGTLKYAVSSGALALALVTLVEQLGVIFTEDQKNIYTVALMIIINGTLEAFFKGKILTRIKQKLS